MGASWECGFGSSVLLTALSWHLYVCACCFFLPCRLGREQHGLSGWLLWAQED